LAFTHKRIVTLKDALQSGELYPNDAPTSEGQYKQIGNAVPVNLALAMGRSLIALLNSIEAENTL
jgi:site-specific DNA-cytosine methylase